MIARKSSEKLLTVKEAEGMTGRKASTWRRDILERRIPFVRIGRQVRIPQEVIEEIIKQGWVDPVQVGGAHDR